MKYLPVPFIIFLLQLQIVCAQTGKITGTVFDQHTKRPLENVNVMLFPPGIGAVTDAGGVYTFIEVREGTCQMVVSHVGYMKFTRETMVNQGQATTKRATGSKSAHPTRNTTTRHSLDSIL